MKPTRVILLGMVLLSAATPPADAQGPQQQVKRSQKSVVPARPSPVHIHEDEEVKIPIPASWAISDKGSGRIVLKKDRYTLSLLYHTMHASGIQGGRFVEMMQIPWLDINQAWACSSALRRIPYPATRQLMFMNLILDTSDPQVRETCGITKNLGGYWKEEKGVRKFVESQRWLAGHFTTAEGGWFFYSQRFDCQAKVYTLTYQAKTPEELLLPNDPGLRRVIDEATDIVNSIHYKSCAPAVHVWPEN